MKPSKTVFALCLGLMPLYALQAQNQQVIELSTGVLNNGNMAAVTAPEDTWTFTWNNGPQTQPFVCPNFASWAQSNCSQWITPVINAQNNGPGAGAQAGMYRYSATFNLNCPTESAFLNINSMGGDNDVQTFLINGQPYNLDAIGDNDFNPLMLGIGIPLTATDLVLGQNTITVLVNNTGSFTGFNFCGNITVNPQPIVPTITGNTNFCAGAGLTFIGNDGVGLSNFHTWQIVESNSAGVPVLGAITNMYSFNSAPGVFTFPNSGSYTCGKYYRIRLSASGPCQGLVTTDHVIFIACPPTANAGLDVAICEGTCTTIGVAGSGKLLYNWTYLNNGVLTNAGTTPTIQVCPEQTTTYTLTVSSVLGCSSTDQVTVTVLENDPMFSFANYAYQSTYYTLTATANVIPNGNYTWILQELDGSGNPLFTITGGASLWNTINTSFPGFNHPANTYLGNYTSLPASPAQGRFRYNRTYRITRGVWTNTCPWRQASLILSTALRGPGEEVTWREDTQAPDLSYLQGTNLGLAESDVDVWHVYPNPSNGVFTVSLPAPVSGTVRVFDLMGKMVQEIPLRQHQSDYRVDLSGYAKGIYVVNVNMGQTQFTKKVLVQ